jgi:hypothetical protein
VSLSNTSKDSKWCKEQIECMLSKAPGFLRNEDLIMLIGMFTHKVGSDQYGNTKTIDVALTELHQRKTPAVNPPVINT